MKKKLLLVLLLTVLLLPISVSANIEQPKVKVYMFYAGGCPACEALEDYLKGLEGYNKTFELLPKEAYVDNKEWKNGKDFDLSQKASDMFEAKGYGEYEERGYHLNQSTPFVVISGTYAAVGYNTGLESVINEIAKAGDKDVIGCIEAGKKDCDKLITEIEKPKKTTDAEETTTNTTTDNNMMAITIICSVAIIAVYLVKSTLDTKKIIETLKK